MRSDLHDLTVIYQHHTERAVCVRETEDGPDVPGSPHCEGDGRMKPGDIVFWEDHQFGHHRFWRIESVLLGALRQEGLVRIVSLSHNAGADEAGERQRSTLVPEPLIRGRVFVREEA